MQTANVETSRLPWDHHSGEDFTPQNSNPQDNTSVEAIDPLRTSVAETFYDPVPSVEERTRDACAVDQIVAKHIDPSGVEDVGVLASPTPPRFGSPFYIRGLKERFQEKYSYSGDTVIFVDKYGNATVNPIITPGGGVGGNGRVPNAQDSANFRITGPGAQKKIIKMKNYFNFLVILCLASCVKDHSSDKHLQLYHTTVSDFILYSNFNSLELKPYFESCLAKKGNFSRLDSILVELAEFTKDLKIELHNLGGGLDIETFFLKEDTNAAIVANLFLNQNFIERIVHLEDKLIKCDCGLHAAEALMVKKLLTTIDVFKSIMLQGSRGEIALGHMYFLSLHLESTLMFTAIKICKG